MILLSLENLLRQLSRISIQQAGTNLTIQLIFVNFAECKNLLKYNLPLRPYKRGQQALHSEEVLDDLSQVHALEVLEEGVEQHELLIEVFNSLLFYNTTGVHFAASDLLAAECSRKLGVLVPDLGH